MEIFLIFKTHLDLGYTDHAARIEEKYMTDFIPHALDLAEKLQGTEDPFIWTTGAWLIDRFLQSCESNRIRMENAIKNGLIAWHALPFTMHAEMMDKGLYEYGISVAKKLDARFGKNTVAAKATDVPGMTKAVVPLLAKAGIKMLHVGVNPFSAVPDVPSVFKWRAPEGEEITMVYSKVYGETTPLPGTDKMLMFAMTNDNLGPQTPQEIHELYASIRAQYPGAYVHAATLDDVAMALEEAKPDLPIVTSEIGDSWAHGYQSDPGKQSMYRAMLRFARDLPAQERDKAYARLLLVAEHTCGVCGATYIADNDHYARKEFEEQRKTGRYAYAEASWQEQRDYALQAADALSEPYRAKAQTFIAEYKRPAPEMVGEDISVTRDMYPGTETALGRFTLTIGYDGAIYGITLDGKEVVSPKKRLFGFQYEVFSPAETLLFCENYQKDRVSWGYDDFSKRGLEKTHLSHMKVGAAAREIRKQGDSLLCRMACEEYFSEKYGCPKDIYMEVTAKDDTLLVEFFWQGKKANRIPECLSLELDNPDTGIAVNKIGMWIDPCDTVSRGGRALHGMDEGFRLGNMKVASKDAALVSFGSNVWRYDDKRPEPADGARIILYDNQWNTNFPFWYEEDARFRFELTF